MYRIGTIIGPPSITRRTGRIGLAGERLSNVIGFDDGPFDAIGVDAKGVDAVGAGAVTVVGTVYAGLRLDGAVVGTVTRDGDDATDRLAELIVGSRFREHLQLVMLEGIAVGGFNVVDLRALSDRVGLPVLVLCRRKPDLDAIRAALLERVPGGAEKWRRIEEAGPMESLDGVESGLWLQRVGLSMAEAVTVVRRFAVHGLIPEPLRVAHILARAFVLGESRGRV